MRVLWILNIVMPYPAKYFNLKLLPFGGWLEGMLNKIKNDSNIELAAVSFYDGRELLTCTEDNVTYYLLPKNNRLCDENLKGYYQEVVDKFKPQLVHIHGTEYSHGFLFLKNFREIRSVVSIQGIMCEISKQYLAGISRNDIFKTITIRDILRKDSVLNAQKKFYARANYEKKTLSLTNAIIGRTDWDRDFCKNNFPTTPYYKCNENLRDCFYTGNIWNIGNIERHSIMFSQITYPIKGFHLFLKALSVIKKKYPDVKVYVTGQNILCTDSFKKKLKLSGYARYLKKLVKKYKLNDNIIFYGMCDSVKVKELLLKSNVFIQSSVIENSSNALGEAMILGVPCIVSDVGGTRSLINENEGLIYDWNNLEDLAKNIESVFEDDEKCVKLSVNARKRAIMTHDRDKNFKNLIEIYYNIIAEGEK